MEPSTVRGMLDKMGQAYPEGMRDVRKTVHCILSNHQAAEPERVDMTLKGRLRNPDFLVQHLKIARPLKKDPDNGEAARVGETRGYAPYIGIFRFRSAREDFPKGVQQRFGAWDLWIRMRAILHKRPHAQGLNESAGLKPSQFLAGTGWRKAREHGQGSDRKVGLVHDQSKQGQSGFTSQDTTCTP